MKKLKKLKLAVLSKEDLEQRQMNILKGGNYNCEDPGCCDDYLGCNCGSISPLNADSSSFWRWT